MDDAHATGGGRTDEPPDRVVMFVLNPCRTDARVLREAAALSEAGREVTIVARTDEAYAATGELEDRDGIRIVRVPVGRGPVRWLLLARYPRRLLRELGSAAAAALREPPLGWLRLLAGVVVLAICVLLLPLIVVVGAVAAVAFLAGRVVPVVDSVIGLVGWRLRWRYSILGWAAAASEAAPVATHFHAHDLPALPAALAASERGGDAGRAENGARGTGIVIYDSHEIFVEAGRSARRPAAVRQAMRGTERRLAGRAAALVTVNEALARVLGRELGVTRTVVVRNCPPRWTPPEPPERRVHAALGLPAEARVVLYHGGLVPERGIEELIAALPALPPEAVVVVMGYGPLRDALVARASEPGLAGRLHVLPAVPPDELLAWVAGADVAVAAIQPTTLNHRLSTPNKLFEALGAGVPVVASDFEAMREIVVDDPDGPLGAVCDPTDPAAIAAAVGGLLALDPAAFADLRARCLRAAHARYCWETEAARLVELYTTVTGLPW